MKAKPPRGYGRNKRIPAAIKLWFGVVVANVIGLVTATFVAAAIRAVPATEGTETALRFAYYAALIFAAVIDALWIDEVLFKGSFRRSHLGGKGGNIKTTDDIEEVAATLQRSDISFPVAVVLCCGLTYLLFNFANHDFDHYYDMVGKHASALRGTDPERAQKRREAIAALSIRREPEVLPILFEALKRDDEVAAWSAWAIGRHFDIKRRKRMIVPLVEASQSDQAELRTEAAIALARLQHRPSAAKVQAELTAVLDADEPIDVRLVWVLGYVQQIESFPVLERALYHRDPQVARIAAWALAQHRDQTKGRSAVSVLEARLPAAPFEVKCAIVHSLGILSDESSNLALMHGVDALPADQRNELCASERLHASPDGKLDRQDLLMPTDSFAMKTIQSMAPMRATSDAIRTQVEPWLTRFQADETISGVTREAASSLLRGIRSGRDDSVETSSTP